VLFYPIQFAGELRGDFLRRLARWYIVCGTASVALLLFGLRFGKSLLAIIGTHWAGFLLVFLAGLAVVLLAIVLPLVAAACFAESVLQPRSRANRWFDWAGWGCVVAVAFLPGLTFFAKAANGINTGVLSWSRRQAPLERGSEAEVFWLMAVLLICGGTICTALVAVSFHRSIQRYRKWRSGQSGVLAERIGRQVHKGVE
jgi:hypothetical protein